MVLDRFEHKRCEEMHHLVTACQRDWIKEAVAKVGVHLTVTRRGTASAVLAALARVSGKGKVGVTGAGVEDGEGC